MNFKAKLVAVAVAFLAVLATLAGTARPAAAQECGCRETGEYRDPTRKAPVADDTSPGGGAYRLITTQVPGEVQLRVERTADGSHVKTFFIPLLRDAWGFSPDGDRIMVRHGFKDAQIDAIVLYDLAANKQVYYGEHTAGAAVAFSPHGKYFLVNVLNKPGESETIIKDAVTGATALYAPMIFEAPPGYPGDKFGVIGGGFSSEADDRSYVWAYRTKLGTVEMTAKNLQTGRTIVSTPVGEAWWKFSKCGDAFALVNQTDQASVPVTIYKTTGHNELVGPTKWISPIPNDLVVENTLDQHRVLVYRSDVSTVNVGPNTADTTCTTPPALGTLALAPTSVLGGERNATGTIELTAATPSSLVVSLSSSNTSVASVPSSVTLLAGERTKTFTVTSKPVTANRTATIKATMSGVTKSAILTVTPPPPEPGPGMESLTLNNMRPMGGSEVEATVLLNKPAPAGGTSVALQSTNPGVASVPSSMTVPANSATGTFTITTSSVDGDTPVTISASAGGSIRSQRLTVITADRECRPGISDAATETLKARAFAAYDDANQNADCVVNTEFTNGITVKPGTSGLAPGTPVHLKLSLRFDGGLHTSPPVGSGGTTAEGVNRYRITDDSAGDSEDEMVPDPVNFSARFTLQEYVYFPDSENVTWQSSIRLDTNTTPGETVVDSADVSTPDAVAGFKDTGILTATYATTVGAHLTITGELDSVASAYGPGASAIANFSNTFQANSTPAPGFEGLELVYDVTNEPVDLPPTCEATAVTTAEDTAFNGTLSCTDPEAKPLTYTAVSGPSHGTLSAIGPNGGFTYTPAADYHGTDSFTYKANDGNSDSAATTATITVTPVNDLPVCAPGGSSSTTEGQAVSLRVSCTDADNDPLAYSVSTAPAGGTVSAVAATGSFTYTPNAGYTGTDTFTLTADDGQGGVATATYSVTVDKVLVGPPTDKDQCKQDPGWQAFNNPTFRNQGECVSYVTAKG